MADFLKGKDINNIEALAAEAFKDPEYNVAEATQKLKESIAYFKSAKQEDVADGEISKHKFYFWFVNVWLFQLCGGMNQPLG